ncbi:hypothetical protein GKE82_11485 [Conexibacter sp. W3-3-2]|uniref:hypothetical protein n=1 Tax=Conexibacter sp. W3-3-2 TaxID=2675227 RepID=UPI0012B7F19B|nr:hypothetical protein [Conexibacter sp. W3-3-2]MTD44897.1 hypothetical protein [Conexibacter sp. W3-3-2]
MPTIVTCPQLAADVETSPRRLSRWLSQQRDAGHPLLVGIPARSPWRFTREQADQLASEFEAAEAESHVSDSAVQRHAEEIIRGLLAERLGVALAPRTITLEAGAPVQVDAASSDGAVLAEIFARQGALKGGQQKKVAIDTLKLITIHREQPAEKLVLCFADHEAAAYATGGGWVAQALRTWGVKVEIIDLPEDIRGEIRAAQDGQTMVNPG